MKLGLIARADNSGLGAQTWEFFRHMDVVKTMVVDISEFNGNKQYPDRYKDKGKIYHVKGFPKSDIINDFLEGLDVVFIAESAYSSYVYTRAKELGVKIAVQYNYEFFDWFRPDMPRPDMLIAPSMWHYDEVDMWCRKNGIRHTYLHCPVNRTTLPFRKINKAKTFLHVAGRSAAYDRNGTESVIMASRYVKSDIKILIHFQGQQGLAHQATHSFEEYLRMQRDCGDPSKLSIVRYEYDDYADVYKQGDVMLLPRRYGGNCLPLNEALSTGMPVIMPAISPNNAFLPQHWLVDAQRVATFTPRTVIDIYDVNPEQLAYTIDKFAGMSENQMLAQNNKANEIADSISWDYLKSSYNKAFEELCTQS